MSYLPKKSLLQTRARVTTILACMALPASAGGLYIREFGQPAAGMSGAGANVLAVDASTAFQNPAGVFKLEKDSNWMVTAISLISEVEFDTDDNNTIQGDDGGDAGGTLWGGAAFFTHRFNDKWATTVALNSFSGSAVDYGASFAGRYLGYETKLTTVSLLPSIAYQFNDSLSISAGLSIYYGEFDLHAAVPPLLGPAVPQRDGAADIEDGDDYDIAPSVSALWQLNDRVRLGVAWLGERTLDFDGDLDITLPGPGSGTGPGNIDTDVKVVFPQLAAVSGSWQATDQLMFTTRVAWEEWSQLDSVPISTSNAGAAIPLEWDDVWSMALGLQYKPGGRTTWYTGVAYDSDPSEAQYRLPVLPLDEQWRFSGGLTYALDGGRSLGFTATYVDLGEARIDNTSDVGRFSGDYDTNHLLVLGVSFAF